MDEDIIRRIATEEAHKVVSSRFNNIGIYDDTPDRVEASRANSVMVNSLRLAHDEGQGTIKRVFANAMSNFGGQALWVILAAASVAIWRTFKGSLPGQ